MDWLLPDPCLNPFHVREERAAAAAAITEGEIIVGALRHNGAGEIIPPSSTSFFFRFQMNHQLDGMSKKKLPSISTQKPKHRINK